jgi:hypothetical protein
MTLLSGGSKMVPHDEQNGQGIMTTKAIATAAERPLLLSYCVCALKMIQYSIKYVHQGGSKSSSDELQQYQH